MVGRRVVTNSGPTLVSDLAIAERLPITASSRPCSGVRRPGWLLERCRRAAHAPIPFGDPATICEHRNSEAIPPARGYILHGFVYGQGICRVADSKIEDSFITQFSIDWMICRLDGHLACILAIHVMKGHSHKGVNRFTCSIADNLPQVKFKAISIL